MFDESKLIPCPICGSTDISLDTDADNDEGILNHVIECKQGHFVEAEKLEDAIEKWNKGLAT